MPDITFVQWLKNRNLSYRTVKEYKRYLIIFGDGIISQQLINKFLAKNNNIMARAFLKNLKEYTIEICADEIPPEELTKIYRLKPGNSKTQDKPKREKIIISTADVKKIEGVFKKEVIKIMVSLQYYCALRCSELFLIRIGDFKWREWEEDPENNSLVLIRGKGGTIENVLVPPFLMERISQYIANYIKENPSATFNYMFNLLNRDLSEEPKLKQDIEKWESERFDYIKKNHHQWNTLLKRAAIKAINQPISTHVLRRSFATFLINNGWNLQEVQEHLRHKNITTTQIYAHISKERLSKRYSEILAEQSKEEFARLNG